MRPRLLDLFCGAGGAAMGYHRAGFDVVGVDIKPQPNYPFQFIQDDALEAVKDLLAGLGVSRPFECFDAIHASPPCQAFTRMQRQRKNADAHPDLVAPVRGLLKDIGLPYVIENVENAELCDPILICGSMFDPPMEIRWHRLFEANWPLRAPVWPCRHKLHAAPIYPGTPNGSGKRPGARVVNPYASETTHDMCGAAKGIDWLPSNGRKRPTQAMNDAIPPAYTELIGHQLMQHVRARAA